MHQPITIAKVRKATKISVQPGQWIILVQPDEPFSTHAEKRRELSSGGDIHADYEIVAVGRMDNKYADLRFTTSEEKKALADQMSEANASLQKSVEDAKARQAQLGQADRLKEAAAHAARVAEVNKMNDQIREKKLVQ